MLNFYKNYFCMFRWLDIQDDEESSVQLVGEAIRPALPPI